MNAIAHQLSILSHHKTLIDNVRERGELSRAGYAHLDEYVDKVAAHAIRSTWNSSKLRDRIAIVRHCGHVGVSLACVLKGWGGAFDDVLWDNVEPLDLDDAREVEEHFDTN